MLMSVHRRDLDTRAAMRLPFIVLRPTICPAALIPLASASSHPHPAGINRIQIFDFSAAVHKHVIRLIQCRLFNHYAESLIANPRAELQGFPARTTR